MHALSVRLSGKRLFIADLAGRLEAMENGDTPMNALASSINACAIANGISHRSRSYKGVWKTDAG